MKMLLLTLSLVGSQVAFAGGLYYGAKSEKYTKTEFCSYNFSVPQVIAAPGSSAPAQQAADALNTKWNAELATGKAEFKAAVLKPDACKTYENAYSVSSTFKIESKLDAVIASIVTTDSGYFGGAHGNHALSGLTFNSNTGEIYGNLGDFVESNKTDALKAAVLAAVEDKVPGFDKDFGWNDWSKQNSDVSQIKNWYFSQDGLVVIFNTYEIASYASGAIEATVYWYQLKEIGALKTSGPATLLDLPSEEL